MSSIDEKSLNMMKAHIDGVYVFSARHNCNELLTQIFTAYLESAKSSEGDEVCPKHAYGKGNNEYEKNTASWFKDCPTCNPPPSAGMVGDEALLSLIRPALASVVCGIVECDDKLTPMGNAVISALRPYLRTPAQVSGEERKIIINDSPIGQAIQRIQNTMCLTVAANREGIEGRVSESDLHIIIKALTGKEA